MAGPTPELIDELLRDKVRQARAMTVRERLSAGGDLFDEVCERMRAGIRSQFRSADDAEVERILIRRLQIAEWLERTP